MLEKQFVFKLLDECIINVDKEKNNYVLPKNISNDFLINPYFQIETEQHTFNFKLIYKDKDKKLFQVLCLSSFKILTIDKDSNIFFEDYFNITKLENSLFYGIFDELCISLIPYTNKNLILCYNNNLYFKDLASQFNDEDISIFFYEELVYEYKILCTNPDALIMDDKSYKHKISNIRDVFEYITLSYNDLPKKIVILLNNTILPIDFFYFQDSEDNPYTVQTFLDRVLDLQTLNIQKRIFSYNSLFDLEMICPNTENDYYDKKNVLSVEKSLPKNDNILIIFSRVLNLDIPKHIYFNSSGLYVINKENILKRPLTYYQKILTLLNKKPEQQVFNLFQFSLYSIFNT